MAAGLQNVVVSDTAGLRRAVNDFGIRPVTDTTKKGRIRTFVHYSANERK